MKAAHLFAAVIAVGAALAGHAAPATHVMEDFEAGLAKSWATWGEHGGKIELADSPDGQGECLLWTFDRPPGAKQPSGLSWRELKLPEGATQALRWALEFSIRGAAPGEGGISVTINESDRSCWRTPRSANITWRQIGWDRVRIPMAALLYAWGNKERAGTAFNLANFSSATFAL